MRTTSQILLSDVVKKVTAHESLDKDTKNKYGIWCHNLPGLIRQSGLASALTFMNSKSESAGPNRAFGLLLKDLSTTPGIDRADKENLVQWVGECDALTYMRATERSLVALQFYKRFAQSVLGVDESIAQSEESE